MKAAPAPTWAGVARLGGMPKCVASMSDDKPPPANGSKPRRPGKKAFDLWLDRGLHEIYDEVAREPVPDELLKLIRDHKGE